MPRAIDTTSKTALSSSGYRINYAVDLTFYNTSTNTEEYIYFWTGIGTLTMNGHNYIGAGELLSISDIEEASDLKATNITITLSGLSVDVVTKALSRGYIGRTARVYTYINSNASMIETFTGLMDELSIDDSPDGSVATVNVEHMAVDLDRVNPTRFTVEAHRRLYPNDTYFSYTQDLIDKQVEWGPKE